MFVLSLSVSSRIALTFSRPFAAKCISCILHKPPSVPNNSSPNKACSPYCIQNHRPNPLMVAKLCNDQLDQSHDHGSQIPPPAVRAAGSRLASALVCCGLHSERTRGAFFRRLSGAGGTIVGADLPRADFSVLPTNIGMRTVILPAYLASKTDVREVYAPRCWLHRSL